MAKEDDALKKRIMALEDREAIYDLVKDYSNAIDDRDIDKYASLMAEHVELCQFEGGNTRVGRQAVRDWMAWRFTQWGLSRHYPLNHRITELNESDGKGIVNGWAEMAMDGKIYVTAIRYYDDYIREDGEWRFARRETAMYYYASVTDLPAIYATPYRKLFRGDSDEVVARRADLPEALPGYQASTHHEVPEANAVLGE
ncbi:MAG TPA: nuclear transport factor 2 family protein [Acidimicrobiales bacterium]